MELSHFDERGNAVMLDVSPKADTARTAVARGRIRMRPATLAIIRGGKAEKGDVLGVARVAGIMAAKKTWELIPMCHPLILTNCVLDFILHEERSEIEAVCTVRTTGKTGVEMEALTGVSAALLTVYDMCKAVDRGMALHDIGLWEKSGGKSGDYRRENT